MSDRLLARMVDRFAEVFGWRSTHRATGWLRDRADPRDLKYQPSEAVLRALSKRVDMRSDDGPLFHQGSIGSCSANCWVGLFMFLYKKQYGEEYVGSRLQLYYDMRKRMGKTDQDSGAYMRDGAKCLSATGVGPESIWPYETSRFREEPPAACYSEGAKHKIGKYMSVSYDLNEMKACLSEGYPFVFGFTMYNSFQSASVSRTGIVPLPSPGERIVSGHAMEAIGYIDADGELQMANDGLLGSIKHALRLITGDRSFAVQLPRNVFICRNSWGSDWGDGGYCFMPYEYLTNKEWAADFWTVRDVTRGS